MPWVLILIILFAFIFILGIEIGYVILKKYFFSDVILATQIYPCRLKTKELKYTCKGFFYTNQWSYDICTLALSDRFLFFEIFKKQKSFISSPIRLQIPIGKLIFKGKKTLFNCTVF